MAHTTNPLTIPTRNRWRRTRPASDSDTRALGFAPRPSTQLRVVASHAGAGAGAGTDHRPPRRHTYLHETCGRPSSWSPSSLCPIPPRAIHTSCAIPLHRRCARAVSALPWKWILPHFSSAAGSGRRAHSLLQSRHRPRRRYAKSPRIVSCRPRSIAKGSDSC